MTKDPTVRNSVQELSEPFWCCPKPFRYPDSAGMKKGQNTPKVTNLDRIGPTFVTPKVLPSQNCGQKSKETVFELEQTFLKCLISSFFTYIYEAKYARICREKANSELT
jgi:hypothetical protein